MTEFSEKARAAQRAYLREWRRKTQIRSRSKTVATGREKQHNSSKNRQRAEEAKMMQFEPPRMMSIRAAARLGPLSEYTLRLLEKQGKLPCIHTGRKCLVNYDRLLEILGGLGE